jgi:virginiamycin B lyase
MKITRTSRLNALTPGLILALLLLSAGTSKTDQTSGTFLSLVPSATAQETTRAAVQEKTLGGTSQDVVATTTSRARVVLAGTFTEFSLPPGALPQLMAASPDGSIYYTQAGSNKIGQIALPSSVDPGKLMVRDFPIPTANSFPEGIVVAPDGNVWFTEQYSHQIGRLEPKEGVITEFPTPTLNSGPVGITVGPDNNIWFTEAYSNKIGKLDPNNPEKMEEFSIPTAASAPLYITSGPDGALWFVGVRSHKLGRIDPSSHAIVEYPMLTPKAGPTSLIVGPDNAIWVTELNADKIARFDVKTRKFTDEIPISSRKNGPRAGPGILVNGPDGNIWFTQMLGNQITRLNPKTKQIHEFSAPSAPTLAQLTAVGETTADTAKEALLNAHINLKSGEELGPTGGPGGIVVSQDGTIWYTAMFSNKIARLRVR